MISRAKQYLLIGAIGAALYFLMSTHIIFYGEEANFVQNIYFLKKSKLNLHYTFVSLNQQSPENIMKIRPLREDGIAELLVEIGMMSDAERSRLENKYR
jgi:hypothetical protein